MRSPAEREREPDRLASAPDAAPALAPPSLTSILVLQRGAGNQAAVSAFGRPRLARITFKPAMTSRPEDFARMARGGEIDTNAMEPRHRAALLDILRADRTFAEHNSGRLLLQLAREVMADMLTEAEANPSGQAGPAAPSRPPRRARHRRRPRFTARPRRRPRFTARHRRRRPRRARHHRRQLRRTWRRCKR